MGLALFSARERSERGKGFERMSTAPRLAVLLLLALPAWAQGVSAGIRGGVPLTDAFDTVSGLVSFRDVPHHWILGPTLEVRLPFGLGVTFDALYRRLEYEREGMPGSETGGQWDFPVMLRYRFSGGAAQPFVAGGASFNKITDLNPSRSTAAGYVVGTGIELKAPFLRFTPEIRYTHPVKDNFELDGLRTNRDQLVFLLGVTF
jgi:hypothetical protein